MDIINNRILKSEEWQVCVHFRLDVDGRWYGRVFEIDVEQGNKGEEEKGGLKGKNRNEFKVIKSWYLRLKVPRRLKIFIFCWEATDNRELLFPIGHCHRFGSILG